MFEMKKLIIIPLLILFNGTVNASSENVEMYIELNNNKYEINTACYGRKNYEFAFESKDHTFENYNFANFNTVLLSTDKYAINVSKVLPKNKSLIKVLVEESEFKKIYKSPSLRVDFNTIIFNQNLIHEKAREPLSFGNAGNPYLNLYVDKSRVKPLLSLTINQEDLFHYMEECKQQQNIYKQKLAEKRKEIEENKRKEKLTEESKQKHLYKKNKQAALEGDPKAQVDLAVIYFEGKGVLKDYKEGFRWLSKAAESGYPDAQYLKGKIYAVGMYGNLKDLKKSKIWVKKAHENGQKQARNIWEKYELWNY